MSISKEAGKTRKTCRLADYCETMACLATQDLILFNKPKTAKTVFLPLKGLVVSTLDSNSGDPGSSLGVAHETNA
jgi:hypothetical protein